MLRFRVSDYRQKDGKTIVAFVFFLWYNSFNLRRLQAQAIYRIGKGEPPAVPENLSKDARDFIKQCIRVNPDDRPTAAELLEHPFLHRPLYTALGSESPMMRGRSI